MNAIDHMKKEIIRKAEIEAAEIIEKAEKKSQAIIEEAHRDASEVEKRALKDLALKSKMLKESITREAITEGKSNLLQTKDTLISKVFERVEKEVQKLPSVLGDKYLDLLTRLIEEGVRSIGEQKIFYVRANRRDTDLIRKHVERIEKVLTKKCGWKMEIQFSNDTLDCIGGVIVSSTDERLIYYNTFESQIMKKREEMRFAVAQILFRE